MSEPDPIVEMIQRELTERKQRRKKNRYCITKRLPAVHDAERQLKEKPTSV